MRALIRDFLCSALTLSSRPKPQSELFPPFRPYRKQTTRTPQRTARTLVRLSPAHYPLSQNLIPLLSSSSPSLQLQPANRQVSKSQTNHVTSTCHLCRHCQSSDRVPHQPTIPKLSTRVLQSSIAIDRVFVSCKYHHLSLRVHQRDTFSATYTSYLSG